MRDYLLPTELVYDEKRKQFRRRILYNSPVQLENIYFEDLMEKFTKEQQKFEMAKLLKVFGLLKNAAENDQRTYIDLDKISQMGLASFIGGYVSNKLGILFKFKHKRSYF